MKPHEPHEVVDIFERSLKHLDTEGQALIIPSIQALRKQIPMKPDGLEWDRMSVMRFGICKCGQKVHEPHDGAEVRYCYNCGQAIYWGMGGVNYEA